MNQPAKKQRFLLRWDQKYCCYSFIFLRNWFVKTFQLKYKGFTLWNNEKFTINGIAIRKNRQRKEKMAECCLCQKVLKLFVMISREINNLLRSGKQTIFFIIMFFIIKAMLWIIPQKCFVLHFFVVAISYLTKAKWGKFPKVSNGTPTKTISSCLNGKLGHAADTIASFPTTISFSNSGQFPVTPYTWFSIIVFTTN